MKAYEVLTLAQPMIEALSKAGVNAKDVRYVRMYDEYTRLKSEGHKMTYIEVYLCDEYNIRKTKFYELIKQFETDI